MIKKLTKKEIEDLLEHQRAISTAKEKVLLSYITEMEELYKELHKKMQTIKEKEETINQTKRILAQNERVFTLGIMSASLAHEVKNPLIVISGMLNRLEKLIKDKENGELHETLQIIKKEVERIQGIMNRLTEFYKPQPIRRERKNINELIIETIKLTQHYLERFKNVNIVTKLSDNVPEISYDKGQIQQVLVNLIINAAQSMPKGGTITISTSLNEQECNGNSIRIDVEDTGVGIPEENIEKIFQPFFSTKPPEEGTGLGLSISKDIIEKHSGKIKVKSEVSKGTCFSIFLPCKD
ncbi:MAG: ATP-binding protein [Proteobacteria bacterium]|nr:ATP-binding protein [Pseudomonadota bacterium]